MTLKNLSDSQKKTLLFLVGCMGSRSALTYFVKSNPKLLNTLGKLAILPAFGIILIFIFGLRKTGAETLGAEIWWNSLRPIHAAIWLSFAYFALRENKESWKILAGDTVLGFGAWIAHKYIL